MRIAPGKRSTGSRQARTRTVLSAERLLPKLGALGGRHGGPYALRFAVLRRARAVMERHEVAAGHFVPHDDDVPAANPAGGGGFLNGRGSPGGRAWMFGAGVSVSRSSFWVGADARPTGARLARQRERPWLGREDDVAEVFRWCGCVVEVHEIAGVTGLGEVTAAQIVSILGASRS
jgi:hypothetical protein